MPSFDPFKSLPTIRQTPSTSTDPETAPVASGGEKSHASSGMPRPPQRAPRSSRSAKTRPRPFGLKHAFVSGLALAATTCATASSRSPRPSAAEAGVGPGPTIGPEPGVPYIARGSLKVPFKTFVGDMAANIGQKEGNLPTVRNLIFRARRGRPPQLSAKGLEQAMKEYTPQVVDAAMTQGSICGTVKEQTIEKVIQNCLRDIIRHCPGLDESGRLVVTAEQDHCDTYSALSPRFALAANIARLAVRKATANLDHTFAVPAASGPTPAMDKYGGGAGAIHGTLLPNSTRIAAMLAVGEESLKLTGYDLAQLVAVFVHEVFHALENAHFRYAIHQTFPGAEGADALTRRLLMEFATEFLATHLVTRDATDFKYETRWFSNDFMIRVLEAITSSSPLQGKAYQDGVQVVSDAFFLGEPNAVARYVSAVRTVVDTFGRPGTSMRMPASSTLPETATVGSSAMSPVPGPTPVGGGASEPPAPDGNVAGAIAALIAAGAGAALVRRRRDSSSTGSDDGDMVTAPTSPDRSRPGTPDLAFETPPPWPDPPLPGPDRSPAASSQEEVAGGGMTPWQPTEPTQEFDGPRPGGGLSSTASADWRSPLPPRQRAFGDAPMPTTLIHHDGPPISIFETRPPEASGARGTLQRRAPLSHPTSRQPQFATFEERLAAQAGTIPPWPAPARRPLPGSFARTSPSNPLWQGPPTETSFEDELAARLREAQERDTPEGPR